jgi:endonuclease G, mitochondrial
MKLIKITNVFALLAMLALSACGDKSNEDPASGEPITENYLLGNPSKATRVVSNTSNYLLIKDQFVLAYNNGLGRANWVGWHLASKWVGNTPRQNNFRPDSDLPDGYYRVGSNAFSGSGFDRGHLCPSSDRDANVTDNSATFVMSNMIAQAPNVNQENWEKLESYCRKLVSQGNELYIYAGGYGEGGSGSNGGTTKRLDNGNVIVPSNCWKIVVVIPEGEDDLSRIDTKTRVIAVNIPNKQSAGSASWGTYRVSVRDLETQTGYDFLSQLPKSIQDVIEKVVDNGPTE